MPVARFVIFAALLGAVPVRAAAPAPSPTEPAPAPAEPIATAPAPAEQVTPAPADEVITVTGTRSQRLLKDSPVPVIVVGREEIQAAGDNTAADALTRVAGVHIDTALRTGQTPQIQGFASKHVLVLIDGRRANGRLSDDFDLARIPAASIERIEVLKGASSVLYGSDAIGGVINVITRKPKRGVRSNASLSRDGLHRDEASVGVEGGNDTVTARLDGINQQGPAYNIDKKDIANTGNGYNRNNAQLELGYHPTAQVDVTATMATEDGTTNGVAQGTKGAVLDRTTNARGRSVALGTAYRPDTDSDIRLEVGGSRRVYGLFENQRDGDAVDRRANSTEQSRDASLVASHTYAEHHETVGGVEVSSQDFVSNQLEHKEVRLRTGTFLQHEWRALPDLALVPGLRYDRDDQFGGHLSKAFAVRYDATPEVIVRASYGEGYRAPSFSELYLNFDNPSINYHVSGNANLHPELSQSLQSSIAWQPNRDAWLSLGVFNNRVHDLIATTRSQPAGVLLINYANIDSVLNRGVEASGRLSFARRVVLGADYTFLDARDQTHKRTLEGRPMHSGNVQARYDGAHGVSSAVLMELSGRRPFYVEAPGGVIDTQWAKAYRSVTVRLAKKFEPFELFTGVRNLTNEAQEKVHPVPPRSYFGGVGAEF